MDVSWIIYFDRNEMLNVAGVIYNIYFRERQLPAEMFRQGNPLELVIIYWLDFVLFFPLG